MIGRLMLKEPFELQQLEIFFQTLKPKAVKEGYKIYFTCADDEYRKKIGEVWEWVYYEYKIQSLKNRVKYKLMTILERERRIKVCDCGSIIWDPKPWKDICDKCMKSGYINPWERKENG